jgi:soluble lytic murein transglycosylase-like protein
LKLYGSCRWGRRDEVRWPLGLALWAVCVGAQALDAQSCAALREQGQKFSLGLAACPPSGTAPTVAPGAQSTPAAAAQPRLLPRAAQAQQLHLFERGPAAAAAEADSAAATAVPARRTRGARSTPQQPPRHPAALTRALQLAPAVEQAAADHAIDPLLLHAIARVESRHNPAAVSPAGARGLMQVMPATGARFGVGQAAALHDAPTSLAVSARYIRVLHRRFHGQLPLVLAAYNAGEGAVERHGRRIPPYAETQAYVRQVLVEYARLQAAAEQSAP